METGRWEGLFTPLKNNSTFRKWYDLKVAKRINRLLFFFFYPHPRTFFSLLLEREEARKRNIDAREKHLSYAPGLGIACKLTRD